MTDTGPDCSALHTLGNLTDLCSFVQNTSSCDIDEGFINYTHFLYCSMSGVAIALSCIILFIWWLFMFIGLAVTADDFFCPSLTVISQSLKLSHNVAGVTFLAFGNGAPDIFSAIAAIGSAKAGDAGLAIGALFGAGVFVTAVVAGSISIISPFKCMERPFLRDVIFYLGAVFWAWYIMWDKKITKFEAIGFVALYAVYVIVVIAGRAVNQKLKSQLSGSALAGVLENSLTDSEREREPLIKGPSKVSPSVTEDNADIEIEQAPMDDDEREKGSLWIEFLHDINPIDVEEWSNMRIYSKIYECFKSPLIFLLKLTIPVVDEFNPDSPNELRNWNRLLNSVHIFTGPVFCAFATKLGLSYMGNFPVYGLVILVCAALGCIAFFTTKTDERPFYHTGFGYLGFFVAVVWIYCIANEIVNILQAFGIVFDISDAILGLTLLAWGNSIGDLVADMSFARQGYPRMGISACFGGPLFNMLVGLGLGFSVACLQRDSDFVLEVNLEEMVLAGGLALSLVFSLIVVPLSGFMMTRTYGICLMVIYVTFLIVAILVETNVITNIDI